MSAVTPRGEDFLPLWHLPVFLRQDLFYSNKRVLCFKKRHNLSYVSVADLCPALGKTAWKGRRFPPGRRGQEETP